MPHLIDFYEAHAKDRDKFEIIAFHDATAPDLATVDKNVAAARERYWNGKELPFPILLDKTGATIKAYGVRAFPTMLLIDPEGKLVGEATELVLEEKLPPLPAAEKIARAIDRLGTFNFQEPTLDDAVKILFGSSRLPIRLDDAALRSAGVRLDARIPLKVAGLLTLRSALDLALAADDLTWTTDDKGLVIVPRQSRQPAEAATKVQETINRRVEQRLGEKISFTFKDATLEDVCEQLERQTQENFVLDPAARRAGRLDSKTRVTGEARNEPLRAGLTRLLEPVGVDVVVRDEVIVLTRKP